MDRATFSIEDDTAAQAELLKNLLRISVDLSATRDRRKMLEMILTEARRLTGAEAGTLYIRNGEKLEFVVAQNDALEPDVLAGVTSKSVQVSGDSLAGFVASTGRTINIPDSYRLSPGAPFRINRDFDSATGYRTSSVLALPLKCPDGKVVGVLQLINRIGPAGGAIPFVDVEKISIMSLASMAAVSIHNALLTDQLKQAHLETIIRLSVAAEYRDNATADHIRRISRLAGLIARALRLDPVQADLIQCASPMHDIGKIGIPDSILLKPAPLTPDERKIVETHPLIGAEILGNANNDLMVMAHDIALTHHERWDGTGYPHRLKGAHIPLPGRIACVADVFDALATKRCYKDAYPLDEVVRIMGEEKGKHFDPHVTEAFFEVFEQAAMWYQAPSG